MSTATPRAPYVPAPFPSQHLTMVGLQKWFGDEIGRIAGAIPPAVHFDPREFGLSGQGETDESDKLQKMFDALPERSALALPTPNFKVGLYKTVELREKTALAIISPVWHRDDYAREYQVDPASGYHNGVQLNWGGNKGERVLGVYNCGYLRLSGFSIHGDNAGIGIDVDQTEKRTRICTSNLFERLRLVGGLGNRDWIGLRVSEESKSNCEYMAVDDCYISGNGDIDPTQELEGASIDRGSNVLEWLLGTFGAPADLIGKRVRLACAGLMPFLQLVDQHEIPATGQFNRRLIDARIVERIDDHHVRIDQVAGDSAHNERWLLDEAMGRGFRLGPSYNAMRQIIRNLTAVSLNIGIDSAGGSIHALGYNPGNNDENWRVTGAQADASSETATNSENSRTHLTIQSIPPFTIRYPSLRLNSVCPGTGYIRILSGTYSLKLENGTINGMLPRRRTWPDGTRLGAPLTSTVFDFTEAAGALVISDNMRYQYDFTAEHLGFARRGEPDLHEDVDTLYDAMPNNCLFDSQHDMQPGGALFNGGRRMWGDPAAQYVFAHRGRWIDSTPATPVDDAKIEPQQSSEYLDESTGELVKRVRFRDGRLGTVRLPIDVDPQP